MGSRASPTPALNPELSRIFTRAFSRPLNFIVRELVQDPALEKLLARHRERFTSGDWVERSPPTPVNEPPNMAYARFVTPTVLGVIPRSQRTGKQTC